MQSEAEKIAASMSPENVATARLIADGLAVAARALGASPSDIMGLWNVPGYPELTSNQLMQIWSERHAS